MINQKKLTVIIMKQKSNLIPEAKQSFIEKQIIIRHSCLFCKLNNWVEFDRG